MKKYSLKEFLQKDLPAGAAFGLIVAMGAAECARQDRSEMRATIADQRAQIYKLAGENAICRGIAENAEGVPDAGPARIPAEAPAGADAGLDDATRGKLVFANMRACTYFVDAVRLTTMRRNNCRTRADIHMIIDVASDHCRNVIDLAITDIEKEMAREDLRRLDKYHNHPWVAAGPCPIDEKKP